MVGLEVVLEAFRFYKSRRKFTLGDLLKYARICRVERIMTPFNMYRVANDMRPYLEAIT